MSSGGSPNFNARFMLAANGDLINIDGVQRIFVAIDKVMANMLTGPDIELALKVTDLPDFRRLFAINAMVP